MSGQGRIREHYRWCWEFGCMLFCGYRITGPLGISFARPGSNEFRKIHSAYSMSHID